MHNHAVHEHSGFFDTVILHSLEEFISVLPFLFLAYLFMEFLEHKAGERMENAVRRAGRVGPLWGSLLGIVPQCGFSAAAAGLYSGGVVTLGTLLAIFLSTSDEMLPLMIGQENPLTILKILAVKVLIALIAGFAVDGALRLLHGKKVQEDKHHHEHEHEHHHEHHHEHEHNHEHHDEHDHEHRNAFAIREMCESDGCKCERGIWVSSLFHTLKTGGFVLGVVLLLNLAVYFIGEDSLASALTSLPFLSHLVSSLIGLIPNCAASVVITELYLEGIISAGCMLSGLLVSAGIGLLILFRVSRKKRDCFIALGLLFAVGLLSGILVDLTGLGALL